MDRWLNPPKKQKTESEFPSLAYPQNEFPPQDAVTYPPPSFSTMKKQVRKKKVSNKSKKERIADKSALLAERLGYETTK